MNGMTMTVVEQEQQTSATTSVQIVVREIRLSPMAEWDAFAQACHASYMGSHGFVMAQRFYRRVRVFSVLLGATKIAQCAIAFNWCRSAGEFVDSLQILPVYTELWQAAMTAVLRKVGAGHYTYGSKWSIETPRCCELMTVPGVTIKNATSYLTQVVDFSRWPSWEAYEKAISSNAKRNAAKALKTDPHTEVVISHGIKAIPEVLALTRMRFLTRRRKGMEDWTTFHVAMARYIARTFFMRRGSYTAKTVHLGRTVAYFSGVDFGTSTFYIDGASLVDNGGGAWLLQLRMLRRAWSPNGKFFISMYEAGSDWVGRENILLSRQQCRPTEYPNQVISFRYQPSDCPDR